jgi:class 3 adenylate cyclase
MERDFWTFDGLRFFDSFVPEIAAIVTEAKSNLEHGSLASQHLTTKIQSDAPTAMGTSDYMVAFSGLSKSYCLGLVDMVDSTKVSSKMNEKEWCKYYSIFLNSMSKILQKFGGIAVKNGGDSLLYYFPETACTESKTGFRSCIESGLAMLETQALICKSLKEEGLPSVSYRISADFGKVVIMKSSTSSSIDLIGPPVNMCCKINHKASSNGMVIGGDLYEVIKDMKEYRYKSIIGLSIGLKLAYPIYDVSRKISSHLI